MPNRAGRTGTRDAGHALWQPAEVTSPQLAHPVPVIAARDVPYLPNANRLQNLSIYLPWTPENSDLIGTPVTSLPGSGAPSLAPRCHVHIHGGAWRDPRLTSASVEPAVAHAFFGGASSPGS